MNEMTDTDVLFAIVAEAIKKPDKGKEILEMLTALGRVDIIEQAQIVVDMGDDGAEDVEDDQEPGDELNAE